MIRLLIAILASIAAFPALAQSTAALEHTRVELIAESPTPAAGTKLALGIVMAPKPGWHTYWLNPGDAGAPTRAVWTLPAGATAGALRYPTPETFIVSGLMNYVYAHENVLLTEVAVPAGLTPGAPFPVAVKVDWLVCDDELCVPEGATLKLDLMVGAGGTDAATADAFAKARAALPRAVDWPARFAFEGDRFVLAVPFAQAGKVRGGYFFPAVEGAVGYAAPQALGVAGDALRLETAAESARDLTQVPGVLKLDVDGYDAPLSFEIVATPGEVPATAAPVAAASNAGDGSDGGWRIAGIALLAAVAGGLLLNIMPCVFPILSLKALSLARGGASEADARREALAYTAGIVLTCLALGALILLLRAAGANVGWAFQLQDPRVIAFLLLLMVAIGLNLAGLYEIDVAGRGAGAGLAAKGGAGGAFWTGVLAAFVATPCTGPFMGVALGAAIALPAAAGLAVFAGLGLGLALPFLLLGYVPALRRRLPRPGAWMDRFRRILSIPMFLTALGLAWVLGRQAGVEGMTLGLAAALALALALWWFGRRQGGERRALAPLGLAAASLLAVLLVTPAAQTQAAVSEGTLAAQPFSPEKLASLTAARTPTFVYFTADWCITCKVNERGALGRSEVATAFEKAGVATLVGDWTNADPVIARFLESRGRSGIPLYLFYRPDGTVEELPQILTVDRLTALVA